MTYPGTRPLRQNRNRPNGRASSIQPAGLAAYAASKARTSAASAAVTPANRYVASPWTAIAVGVSHIDKQACSRSSQPGTSPMADAKASASPPAHVAQIVSRLIIGHGLDQPR